MDKIRVYLIFTLILFIFTGCLSHRPGCMNEGNKGLNLRWGTFISKSGKITGYQLNNEAELSKLIYKGSFDKLNDSILFSIDEEKYCRLLGMTRDTILSIQALNEPGDSLHFIEYSDPPRNVRMRAVWNAINKTFGSKGFREIYDSLQTLVPVVR
ncbi:MAG: hypothetical protein EPN82_13850 [Bacteroidetes bacterium]|nr:MAG: hypothetical protein EPN82_13850 [Bacteroidota bacterium]